MNNVLQVPIEIDLGQGEAPIVMVDDEDIDFELVNRFHKKSGLTNPLSHHRSGADFIAYLITLRSRQSILPAVVLMDIHMPRMDGFETVETLRAEQHFCRLPVVMMLSNSSSSHDKARAAAAGADGYLLKSLNPQDYLEFFRSLKQA